MEIRDKNGSLRIKIDCVKKYEGLPSFIQTLFEIRMESMYAKEQIDIEASDFTQLEKHLKLLEMRQVHTCYFRPIEEQIQIKFEFLDTGNILVSGFVMDKMHINKLIFSFETTPVEIFNIRIVP